MSAARAGAGTEPTLGANFYDRPVVEVAQALIGCRLEHGGCSGVIVETEAYHDSEPACHAHIGLTPRTATLLGPPGRAYVYRSYGIHALLNAVCEPVGVGAAVLIRALEPLSGLETMAARRGLTPDRVRDLCSGPGKLTQAFGIELALNGSDLERGRLRVLERDRLRAAPEIVAGRRVGITKAVELPWRFGLAGSRFLSSAIRT